MRKLRSDRNMYESDFSSVSALVGPESANVLMRKDEVGGVEDGSSARLLGLRKNAFVLPLLRICWGSGLVSVLYRDQLARTVGSIVRTSISLEI